MAGLLVLPCAASVALLGQEIQPVELLKNNPRGQEMGVQWPRVDEKQAKTLLKLWENVSGYDTAGRIHTISIMLGDGAACQRGTPAINR